MTCKHENEIAVAQNPGNVTMWCPRCGRIAIGDGAEMTPSLLELDLSEKKDIYAPDIVPEAKRMESGQFITSECYINILTGDLYIVNWEVNRPVGNEWVRISRACWTIHSGGY